MDKFVVGGGDTGGVDQANVAAGDAVLARFVAGCMGRVADVDPDAEPFAHGSPPSMSDPPDGPGFPPRTSASKLVSSPPLVESSPFMGLGPPKLINSLRDVAVALLAPSSCSLRVCSFSIRADVDLIKAM